MRRGHTSAAGALFFIMLVSAGEFAMVGGQYLAHFDGIVIARTEFVHYPFWTRNLTTRYVIREAGGSERVYHADPSQGHINGFPIGTHLSKRRWRMDYEADGKPLNDFPFPFYFFWMMFDLCMMAGAIVLGVMIHLRDRRNRELEAAFERAQEDLLRGDRDS